MGRHRGPVERLARREGIGGLELEGVRRPAGKSGLERRGAAPPGGHGRSRRGPRAASWLGTDPDALTGRDPRNLGRADIHAPIDEQLVVEHFSRR